MQDRCIAVFPALSVRQRIFTKSCPVWLLDLKRRRSQISDASRADSAAESWQLKG